MGGEEEEEEEEFRREFFLFLEAERQAKATTASCSEGLIIREGEPLDGVKMSEEEDEDDDDELPSSCC